MSLLCNLPVGYFDKERPVVDTRGFVRKKLGCLTGGPQPQPEPFTILLQVSAQDGGGDYEYVRKIKMILESIPDVRVKLHIGILETDDFDRWKRKVPEMMGCDERDITFTALTPGAIFCPTSCLDTFDMPSYPVDLFFSVSSFVDFLESAGKSHAAGFIQLSQNDTPGIYWGELGARIEPESDLQMIKKEFGLSKNEGMGTVVSKIDHRQTPRHIHAINRDFPELLNAVLGDVRTPPTGPEEWVGRLKDNFLLGYHSSLETARDFIQFAILNQESEGLLTPILLNQNITEDFFDEDIQLFLKEHGITEIVYGKPGSLNTLRIPGVAEGKSLRLITAPHIDHEPFMALKSLAKWHGVRGDHSLYEAFSLERPFLFEGYKYGDNFKSETYHDMARFCPENSPLQNYFYTLAQLYPQKGAPERRVRLEMIQRASRYFQAVRNEDWKDFFEQMHAVSCESTVQKMVQLLQGTHSKKSQIIQRLDRVIQTDPWESVVDFIEDLPEGKERSLAIARGLSIARTHLLRATNRAVYDRLYDMAKRLTEPPEVIAAITHHLNQEQRTLDQETRRVHHQRVRAEYSALQLRLTQSRAPAPTGAEEHVPHAPQAASRWESVI